MRESYKNKPVEMVKTLKEIRTSLEITANSVNPFAVGNDETLDSYDKTSFIQALALIDSASRVLGSAVIAMEVLADEIERNNE